MPARPSKCPVRLLAAVLTVATVLLVLFSSAPHQPVAQAAPGSPAVTPPLGWNSWNSFGCGVNETVVRQAADAMVNSGMRDAGYQYVVVDDCWFDPQRDAQGTLRAHPAKFPSGMRALGDYGDDHARPVRDAGRRPHRPRDAPGLLRVDRDQT